jgi:hypothetical protein
VMIPLLSCWFARCSEGQFDDFVGFKYTSRNAGQGSGAQEGSACLQQVWTHLYFVPNIYKNMFVTIPLLVFMFAWCTGG